MTKYYDKTMIAKQPYQKQYNRKIFAFTLSIAIFYRRMLPGLIYFGYYALQQFLIKKCSI
jgi:hypothetical protein